MLMKMYLTVSYPVLNLDLTLRSQYISIYIYFACLSFCLSVKMYPIKGKRAEPIGPNFLVGPRVTPGIRFLKILKIHEIIFIKSAKFLFEKINVHK